VPGRAGRFERAREAGPRPPDPRNQTRQRERTVLQTLLNHPGLLGEFGDEVALLEFKTGGYRSMRDALVSLPHETCEDRAALVASLEAAGLDAVAEELIGAGARYLDWAAAPGAQAPDEMDHARVQLRQTLDLHHRHTDLERVRAEAEQALRSDASEDNWNRLVGVLHAIEEAPGLEDTVEGYRIPPARRRP
jgi:DNA primase